MPIGLEQLYTILSVIQTALERMVLNHCTSGPLTHIKVSILTSMVSVLNAYHSAVTWKTRYACSTVMQGKCSLPTFDATWDVSAIEWKDYSHSKLLF